MTGPLVGYILLAGAALVVTAVLWPRHPGTCACYRCSRRRQRRENAQWAYQAYRGRQAIRRAARAAARTERRRARRQPITAEKPLSRREKRALAAIEAGYNRDSAPEPQAHRRQP